MRILVFFLFYTLKSFVDCAAFWRGLFIVSICNKTLLDEGKMDCYVDPASWNESYVLLNIDRTLQFIRLKMNTTYFKRICEIEVFKAGKVINTLKYSKRLAVACSFKARTIQGQTCKHMCDLSCLKQ